MPSSLVRVKDNGFWATDGSLQVWLAYQVIEIRQLAHRPPWLEAVAEKWHEEAVSSRMGNVQSGLDEILTDTTRPILEPVCRNALKRLAAEMRGGKEYVSLADAGIQMSERGQDLSCVTYFVRAVGAAFLALVRGEMKTGLANLPFVPKNRKIPGN